MEFRDYLKILVGNDGSDLYLTVNAPPAAKFQGNLKPLENEKLTAERLKEIAYSLILLCHIYSRATSERRR
ncbi:MAG: hypothetical protein Kow0065_25210 [Methylomicrobium sp.]